jgi:uncharacterized membrane protein HdeD (DUF308 family)
MRAESGMRTMTKNWWSLVLRGVLSIIFGILVIVQPGIALQTLVLMLGAFMLVDGIFAIVGAVQHRSDYPHWWVAVLEGLLGIVAGIATFLFPGITAITLLYIIAFWAIATGVMEIVGAWRLRKVIENELLLGLAGLASIIFGVLVLFFPGTGALAILGLIAGYAIVFGILMIMLGLRLRNWTPRSTTTSGMSSGAMRP